MKIKSVGVNRFRGYDEPTECVNIFETNFLKSTEIHGGPLSCWKIGKVFCLGSQNYIRQEFPVRPTDQPLLFISQWDPFWFVRIHGVSGINGYREFNNPPELICTIPGWIEGRSGLTWRTRCRIWCNPRGFAPLNFFCSKILFCLKLRCQVPMILAFVGRIVKENQ